MAAPNGALRSLNVAPHGEDLDADFQQLQQDRNTDDKDEEQIGPRKPGLFSVNINIDLMQCFLTLAAVATRFWNLDKPNAIVFDELHYGRFVAMYMKKTFFFDPHPPLGKLLIASMGYMANFDGHFNFDKIGSEYSPNVPIWYLRFVPALCGSLLVPAVYEIMVELNSSRWSAVMAAALILLDNALLTQSRCMLVDVPLLLSLALCLLSALKFCRVNRQNPFCVWWWIWLTILGISITCAISIKYVSILTVCLVFFTVARELWNMLPRSHITKFQLVKQFAAVGWSLTVLPFLLYIAIIFTHLSILNISGPHDDVMSSAFQTSLEGGLAAITKGQPIEVAFGSQITLRHTHGQPCWLHSHSHVYPLRYPDGRGSSHQQQVTCYSFKDVNNWWIIKDPNRNSLAVQNPHKPVRDGDLIQLVHGITSRSLNSHDVAAPVSPQHQEVSCFIDYNISNVAQNLWRVDIVNKETEGSLWNTIKSEVRLIHVNTSQSIKTSGKQLPEWGFYQFEVVTDKVLHDKATTWNVEEHRYTRFDDADDQDMEKELNKANLMPLKPKGLGLWGKILELQVKMLTSQHDYQLEHKFSSAPIEWPLLDRNIAYWVNAENNAQIHLLGNPLIWISGSAAVAVYCGLLFVYLLRRRRQCYDLPENQWCQFKRGGLFLVGYLIHYVPYFMADRTLFLYHYLPSLLYQILLLAFLIEHIHNSIRPSMLCCIFKVMVVVWCTAVFSHFWTFSVLNYGNHPLTAKELGILRWKESWDFVLIERKTSK